MKVGVEAGFAQYVCARCHLISHSITCPQQDQFEDMPHILPTQLHSVIIQKTIVRVFQFPFSAAVVTDLFLGYLNVQIKLWRLNCAKLREIRITSVRVASN